MKKTIVLDMEDVTGEKQKMTTQWDDDLTLKMLERRLTGLLVNNVGMFGVLRFKQDNRWLHKKTRFHNLKDGVAFQVFINVKLDPILEVETSTVGCNDCNTLYIQDYCRTINFVCVKCLQLL